MDFRPQEVIARDVLPWALVVALVGLLVFILTRGDPSSARVKLLEAEIPKLHAVQDSLHAETSLLKVMIAEKDAVYARDSASWVEARRGAFEDIVEARKHASEVSDSLKAHVDSIGASLLASYEAEIDAERAASAEIINNLQAEIEALRTRIALRDDLISTLHEELDASTNIVATLDEANKALHAQITSMNRRRWGERALAVASIVGLSYAVFR